MKEIRWAVLALALGATSGRAAADATPPEPAQKHAFYATPFSKHPKPPALTALGRALFFDPALSASGKQSCSTCHDPAHAYGPPNDRAVQLGGSDGAHAGVRAVPSLRYLQQVPRYTDHFFDDEGGGADQGPTGGYTWDGRAQTAHDQARLPLFSPLEMANPGPAELVARLARAPAGARLREAFGDDVLDSTELGLNAILLALEAFQQSPSEFYPYDSKYDAYLRGKAKLDPAEARGLALFNDPAKGNCASCHPSQIKEGGFPAFTDWGLIALGVPRNRALSVNRDPKTFDLGLCGPYRTDLADHPDACGKFRAPPLRNVRLKKRFMHNGVFTKLEDVIRFYVERDTRPEAWYPRGKDGKVQAFDDLPPPYQDNLNREPPFGGRRGDKPALDAEEIADIVAFLGTLTDGYKP
jgi:cytochrome c peroxidase